jgi:hypothetical protein
LYRERGQVECGRAFDMANQAGGRSRISDIRSEFGIASPFVVKSPVPGYFMKMKSTFTSKVFLAVAGIALFVYFNSHKRLKPAEDGAPEAGTATRDLINRTSDQGRPAPTLPTKNETPVETVQQPPKIPETDDELKKVESERNRLFFEKIRQKKIEFAKNTLQLTEDEAAIFMKYEDHYDDERTKLMIQKPGDISEKLSKLGLEQFKVRRQMLGEERARRLLDFEIQKGKEIQEYLESPKPQVNP